MNISVVIPVHNGETYLAQAIESVLAQTHRDLELLLVDDGSTDATSAIIRHYAARDCRVRCISQENRGVAAAGNRGLEEARFDWAARLDADDVFMPQKLERQAAFIRRNPDVKITGTLAWFMSAEGRQLGLVGTEGPFSRAEYENLIRRDEPVFFVHSSTLMHRPTVLSIGGYREQFLLAEDVDLWIRMIAAGHLMLKVREPLLFYRLHGASLTMTRNAEQRRHQRWATACGKAVKESMREPTLNEFTAWEEDRPWPERAGAFRNESGERLYQRAALHYACGNWLKTLSFVMVAVVFNPRHVIPRLYARKIQPMLTGRLPRRRDVPSAEAEWREGRRYAPGK